MVGTHQIKRFRPQFGLNDLMLSRHGGEESFMPSDFAPHTVRADLFRIKEAIGCALIFEYSIDEDETNYPAAPEIAFVTGKYSGKILEIRMGFSSFEDLYSKTVKLLALLETKKTFPAKESLRKHFEIVADIVSKFHADLMTDPEMQHSVTEALAGRGW